VEGRINGNGWNFNVGIGIGIRIGIVGYIHHHSSPSLCLLIEN
jgi:hypothetical protein